MYTPGLLGSYAVCGVSALLGGALLWFVRLDDANLRLLMRRCAVSMMMLGTSLAQLLFTAPNLGPAAESVMLVGTVGSVPLVASALSALSGQRRHFAWAMNWAALAMAVLQAAAMTLPGAGPGRVYALLGTVGGCTLMAACWPLMRRPRNSAELTLGAACAGYALSWLPRLAGAAVWDGPALPHHVYLPEAVWPAYALLYCVLPLFTVALVLSVAALRLHTELNTRATTDELTGLLMRRALHENAVGVLATSRGAGQSLAVMLCDIDHFKRVNDSFGHAMGDAMLRHVAQTLRRQVRADALVARYGGEEFVVVLQVSGVAAARQVAERLRDAVSGHPLPRLGTAPLEATLSIGVTMVDADDTLESALGRADEALYRAKHGGRNRVEMAIDRAA